MEVAMPASPGLSESYRTADNRKSGYSRYVVLVAAFCAMFVISPYEYAWSSMSDRIGSAYHWNADQIGVLFTLFVISQSIGMLPGGMLMDRFGPRLTIGISGVLSGLGMWALTFGPNFLLVACLWCIGSFFAGFIYNATVTVGNKWFVDRRGMMVGLVAGAFSWGSLPFIFPIRAISHHASSAVFFHVVYVMAACIAVIAVTASLFMRNPPAGWQPDNFAPEARRGQSLPARQYTEKEALLTWQMWLLIASFVLIAGAGLAGISKIVAYSNSFKFAAVAATAATGGIAMANGFGKFIIGWISQRLGCENTMIGSYILCGVLLFLTIVAGEMHSQTLFVISAIGGIFFWASMFSLFPTIIGQYFGEAAAGGNYGVLYAIAKGLGGIYGGIVSTILIEHSGFSFAIGLAAVMAIVAGLIIVPLKFSSPVVAKAEQLDATYKAAETV
jgi:MFS transporter, OFA family, oxalate/formate antiporter